MKSLLPHQRRILEFIEERERNGKCSLIAHDPGCGKTEPILHYLNKNKKQTIKHVASLSSTKKIYNEIMV